MKAIEQYFPVVLFIMLYNVVLTFDPVDEILKWDHSSESYWAVGSCGVMFIMLYKVIVGGIQGGFVGVKLMKTTQAVNELVSRSISHSDGQTICQSANQSPKILKS